MRWFQLGSSIRLHRRTHRAGLRLGALRISSVPMRACTMAPTHIAHGSTVTQSVAPVKPVVADLPRRRAEGANLGVCRRIDRRNRLIEAAATISPPTATTAPIGTSSLAIALRASTSAARMSSSSEMTSRADQHGRLASRGSSVNVRSKTVLLRPVKGYYDCHADSLICARVLVLALGVAGSPSAQTKSTRAVGPGHRGRQDRPLQRLPMPGVQGAARADDQAREGRVRAEGKTEARASRLPAAAAQVSRGKPPFLRLRPTGSASTTPSPMRCSASRNRGASPATSTPSSTAC